MSDDLESLYQNAQKYLQKNVRDMDIPVVATAVGLSSAQTRTACRNFWTSPCEVSHLALRIHVANEFGRFHFDPVDYMETYMCDGYWSANFLVARPKRPLSKREILEIQKQTEKELEEDIKRIARNSGRFTASYTFPTWEEWLRRKSLSSEEREAERQASLSPEERKRELELIAILQENAEKIRLDYESRLTVVGGTKLWKIAKNPLSDAKWLREMALAISERSISLFDPRMKIRWETTYLHQPVPDPNIKPAPIVDSILAKKMVDSLENLNKYFYSA